MKEKPHTPRITFIERSNLFIKQHTMKINKKNITIGVLGAALLATSGLTMASAAYNDDDEHGRKFHQDPAFQTSLETRDFEAWNAQEKLPEKLANLNEAEFNQFADMVALKKSGDIEGAKEIAESLGLPTKHKREQGEMHGEKREEMKQIILNSDFAAWAEKAAEHGMDTEVLTQENFDKIKAAIESGDREAIKAIHDELGITPKNRGPHNGERAGHILQTNYEEWAERAAKHGLEAENINSETFATLQQAAELFESGDKEGGKQLLEDAGVKPPTHANGKRFKKHNREEK